MVYNAQQLSHLLAELRRPHATTRDVLWDQRRDVRHRRLSPVVPPGLQEGWLKNVDYRSVTPEWIITQLKARLGANSPQVATKVRGLQTTRATLGEKVEDWLRGVMDALDPGGSIDADLRDAQTATGIGWAELESYPDYVPPPRMEYTSDERYDQALLDRRMAYGLPYCLSFVPGRAMYWAPIERPEHPKIAAKVVTIPLMDLEGKYDAQGFKIAYNAETQGRFRKVPSTPILGGQMMPGPMTSEWNRLVRIVVMADDKNIYHLMFPTPALSGAQGISAIGFEDDSGMAQAGYIPQLELLASFPNPFGRPPFFSCYGRKTDDPDPAFRFKPLAAEVLDLAVYINNQRTMRMIRAALDMYKPPHMRPMIPPGPNAPMKQQEPVSWRPDMPIEFYGDFLEIPSPPSKDFDVQEQLLNEELRSFNQSIASAVQTGSVGRSTPAWSIMQMNEETLSLLGEAQNSRAACWREILEAVAKCSHKKAHGGPIYVVAPRQDKKQPATHVEDMLGVSGEELQQFLSYGRIEVNIPAETMSMKAASTEYWRTLRVEGTISQETYEENIGIGDRVAEQARKDKETVEQPMKAAARRLALMAARQQVLVSHGPLAASIIDAMIGEVVMGQDAAEGGGQLGKGPALPGQGLSDTPPEQGGQGTAAPAAVGGMG